MPPDTAPVGAIQIWQKRNWSCNREHRKARTTGSTGADRSNRGIAIEVKAIGYDDDNDETSSNDDPDAETQLYARAFQAWADGKISGTAEEIFDAVNAVLED